MCYLISTRDLLRVNTDNNLYKRGDYYKFIWVIRHTSTSRIFDSFSGFDQGEGRRARHGVVSCKRPQGGRNWGKEKANGEYTVNGRDEGNAYIYLSGGQCHPLTTLHEMLKESAVTIPVSSMHLAHLFCFVPVCCYGCASIWTSVTDSVKMSTIISSSS